jgi:hypothetical protein
VGAGDERAVVVEAGVASAFVVVEAELTFELAVVELDRPAQPGEPGKPLGRRVGGEVGEPVVAWLFGVPGPLDDQPFLPGRLAVSADRVRSDDADEGEPGRDVFAGGSRATGERLPGPRRQSSCQSSRRLVSAVRPGNRARPSERPVLSGYRERRLRAVRGRLPRQLSAVHRPPAPPVIELRPPTSTAARSPPTSNRSTPRPTPTRPRERWRRSTRAGARAIR